MKKYIRNTFLISARHAAATCLAGASILLPSAAQAKGTLADTLIVMSSSLDFSLSGVAQENISNIDDTLTFKVDRFEIEFSSIMNSNFRFMAADVSGFTDGTLQLPTLNADCAVMTRQVAFNQASLPANSTASLRVRVKLK